MIVGMKVFRREKRWKLEKKKKNPRNKKEEVLFLPCFQKTPKDWGRTSTFPLFQS